MGRGKTKHRARGAVQASSVAADVSKSPASPAPTWEAWLFPLLLVVAGIVAYANSLGGPFVLDDTASIANNGSLRGGPVGALFPPANGETVTGRPLVNFSFWVNYHLDALAGGDGLRVGGYHAVNLLIHVTAALLLFGAVRRALMLPSLRGKFAGREAAIAFVAALLWLLHPLQTESVTYLAQRAESLMGRFYIAAFYAFVRGVEKPGRGKWLAASAAACWLGVLCKEVMVTAPVMLLFFDRAFVAGSFANAWRARNKFYVAAFASWIPLAGLVLAAGSRGGSAGFGTAADPMAYLLTQTRAVVDYLQLSIWPSPLVFDYGPKLVGGFGEVPLQFCVVLLLLAGTVWLACKMPKAGFLAAWFFVTLAPSSSIVPIATEAMAEHRMYVSLAALSVLAALALDVLGKKRATLGVGIILACVLGLATMARNTDYQSALVLWRDTVTHRPDVARAHENYGAALLGEGQLAAAAAEFERAIVLQPDFPEAENNLGGALARQGLVAEAVPHFAKAAEGLRLSHEKAMAYFNLGYALGQLGQYDKSVKALEDCLKLEPGYPPAASTLAAARQKAGKQGGTPAAIPGKSS